MSHKKRFRSVLIISVFIVVKVEMAAIWFSPVVKNSSQTQLVTSPSISMNIASVNGRDYVNNTICKFLAAESQANVQSAQYKLDSGFINWYVSNVNTIPDNSKNLTQQNTTLLFQSFLSLGENANNLDQNALAQEPTWTGVVDDLSAGLVFLTTAGTVGAVSITFREILELLTGVYSDLFPASSLISLNNAIKTAFGTQESESGIFKIAYEPGYYPDTLSSTYSVYAPILGGGSTNFLSGVNPLTLMAPGPMDSYIGALGDFENQYGLNNPIYVGAPPSRVGYFGQYGPNL